MTYEEGMREAGATEQEIKRALCEHDYGNMCKATFMGCVRTCVKCGQMLGLGRHCAGAGGSPSGGEGA